MIKKKLVQLLNSMGLYTFGQYIEQVEKNSKLGTYAYELEKAILGMSDPARPVVVFSDYSVVRDVQLQPGQQVITSPLARNVLVERVTCLPRTTTN